MGKLIKNILDSEENPIEGHFLVSNLRLDGTSFERSVIYMCQYDETGAMGFVVNKPFGEIEFKQMLAQMGVLEKHADHVNNIPVYYGGPVDVSKGFVLHSSEFQDKTTKNYRNGVCMTANAHILEQLAVGKRPEEFIFILGYSSWGPGQLEKEIEYNSWFLVPSMKNLILDNKCDNKWTNALDNFGIKKRRLSRQQGHA